MIEMVAGRGTQRNEPERAPGEIVTAVAVIGFQYSHDVPHLDRNEMALQFYLLLRSRDYSLSNAGIIL